MEPFLAPAVSILYKKALRYWSVLDLILNTCSLAFRPSHPLSKYSLSPPTTPHKSRPRIWDHKQASSLGPPDNGIMIALSNFLVSVQRLEWGVWGCGLWSWGWWGWVREGRRVSACMMRLKRRRMAGVSGQQGQGTQHHWEHCLRRMSGESESKHWPRVFYDSPKLFA